MFGIPRIKNRHGLSWAPSQPSCHRDSEQISIAGDGMATKKASITKVDLVGEFAVNIFHYQAGVEAYQIDVKRFLRAQTGRPCRWVALLRPLRDTIDSPTACCYRNNINGQHLFAICVSQDRKAWTSQGVYEWKYRNNIPASHSQEILIS
jgi:hypothetical protein